LKLQDLFNRKLNSLVGPEQRSRLAIAVSGGSDSMALALLARNWAADKAIELVTLTVDHGLRPAAQQEAETVSQWMQALNLPHKTLVWRGPHPTTGIQSAAREARYQLMTAYCQSQDIPALLVGHQLEDQLETLLMRLSKGSGLEGLTAMKEDSRQFDLRLLRPLLGVERQTLRDYLRRQDQTWIEDPSNENQQFTRTQVGAILSDLQALPGSSLTAISLSAERMARASTALEEIAARRFEKNCQLSPYGFIRFPMQAVQDCPAEVGLRVLAKIVSTVRGEHLPFKLRSLEKIYSRLFQQEKTTSGTISGVQISRSANEWLVCREPGRTGLPEVVLAGNSEAIWDRRFHVLDTARKQDRNPLLTIRRIGPDGWRYLQGGKPAKEQIKLPAKVRINLPAVWLGDRLIAAPLFSGIPGESAIALGRFKMVFKTLVSTC
jgi:tRNA(Ile)-lysidine synthase